MKYSDKNFGVCRDQLHGAALAYHRHPRPGKLEIVATKNMRDAADLSLAYSPGVGITMSGISVRSIQGTLYTAKGNLDASAPMLPSPNTAVPLVITATRLLLLRMIRSENRCILTGRIRSSGDLDSQIDGLDLNGLTGERLEGLRHRTDRRHRIGVKVWASAGVIF
ncbi:hypothetical protein [Bradyrhizobium niftali]|uniref:hypothetical protein n=1 Tax=Bradyrhizobium niftali TaxID=2560055 RepID=UPI003D316CF4